MSDHYTIEQPAIGGELQTRIDNGQTWADGLAIVTPSDRTQASAGVSRIKGMIGQVVDLFAASKTAANTAHKAICAAEKKLAEPLQEAVKRASQKILAYDAAESAKAAKEAARRQADADADAARLRAKLEREAAHLKTPELRAERLEQAAAVEAPIVQVAAVVPTVKGESTRSVWKAELTDKMALIAAAAGANGAAAASLLAFSGTDASRFASATRGQVAVPGVRFYEEKQLAHRSAR